MGFISFLQQSKASHSASSYSDYILKYYQLWSLLIPNFNNQEFRRWLFLEESLNLLILKNPLRLYQSLSFAVPWAWTASSLHFNQWFQATQWSLGLCEILPHLEFLSLIWHLHSCFIWHQYWSYILHLQPQRRGLLLHVGIQDGSSRKPGLSVTRNWVWLLASPVNNCVTWDKLSESL